MRKILIVEDEELLRDSYKMILSTEPYTIKAVSDGGQALRMCQEMTFDLILLDLMMPRVDGGLSSKNTRPRDCRPPKLLS